MAMVVIDVGALELRCQLAGHPPPVLRRPDGTVERLGGELSPPLGMVSEGADEATASPVEPGTLLVMYSDGLIERRDRDLREGSEELISVVSSLPGSATAAEALRLVADAMVPMGSEDDVAIVVARIG